MIRMEWINETLELVRSRVFDGISLKSEELIARGVPQTYAAEIEKSVDALITEIGFRRRGRFIVISGIDKSGKETQAFAGGADVVPVSAFIKEHGYDVINVLQPSYDTVLGGLVRWYLNNSSSVKKENAWMLWTLDRAQHNRSIAEWLSNGGIVVAKRWTESHVVYQQVQGIEVESILKAERNIIKQDITFILDVDVQEVLKRLNGRGDNYENVEMLNRVRENYMRLGLMYKYGTMVYVDANGSPREVNRTLLSIIKTYFDASSSNRQI